MDSENILKQNNIELTLPVLSFTAYEAIDYLIEAINEYCPNFKISELSKEELLTLLGSYGNCVLLYHPERYHQERGALLENVSILKRHGTTDEEIDLLDFY